MAHAAQFVVDVQVVPGLGPLCAFCRRPEALEDRRRELREKHTGKGPAPADDEFIDILAEIGDAWEKRARIAEAKVAEWEEKETKRAVCCAENEYKLEFANGFLKKIRSLAEQALEILDE